MLDEDKYKKEQICQASLPVAFKYLEEGRCYTHSQLQLRIKSQCTPRADRSTFQSDAIRGKLKGPDVVLNGSVDHTLGKSSKTAQFTLFSHWCCKRFRWLGDILFFIYWLIKFY